MISNHGPNEPIDKTSSDSKGRPKGTPKKNTGFKGTPKKLKTHVQNVPLIVTDNQKNRSIPLDLKNNSNLCFSILLLKLNSRCHLFKIMSNTSLLTGLRTLMLCQM